MNPNYSVTQDQSLTWTQKFMTIGPLKRGTTTVHVEPKLIFPVWPVYKITVNLKTERGLVSVESSINLN